VRSQFIGRKRTSAALGILLSLAVAGGAFAYWTISGTGSGSATAGTVVAVTITPLGAPVTGLYPGGPVQALNVRLSNPNSSPVTVGTLSATLDGTGLPVGCTTADFAVGADVVLDTSIAGNSFLDNNGLTVQMRETGLNQDACKLATVGLEFSVTAAP
jgi:hypothetical protein